MSKKRSFADDSDPSVEYNENVFESARTKACPRKRSTPGTLGRFPLTARFLDDKGTDLSIATLDEVLTEAETCRNIKLGRDTSSNLEKEICSTIGDNFIVKKTDDDLLITPSDQLLMEAESSPTNRLFKDTSLDVVQQISSTIEDDSSNEELDGALSIPLLDQLSTEAQTFVPTNLGRNISSSSLQDTYSTIGKNCINETGDTPLLIAPSDELLMKAQTLSDDDCLVKDTCADMVKDICSTIEENNGIVEGKDTALVASLDDDPLMEAETSSDSQLVRNTSTGLHQDMSSSFEDNSILEEQDTIIIASSHLRFTEEQIPIVNGENSIIEEKDGLGKVTPKQTKDYFEEPTEGMNLESSTSSLRRMSITFYEEKCILERGLAEKEMLCGMLKDENLKVVSEMCEVKAALSEMEKSLQMKEEMLLTFGEEISERIHKEAQLVEELKEEKEHYTFLSEENQEMIVQATKAKVLITELETALQMKNVEILGFEETISRMSSNEVEYVQELKNEEEKNLRLSEENEKLIAETSNAKAAMEKVLQIKVDESLKFEEAIAELSSKEVQLVKDLNIEKDKNVWLSEEKQKMSDEICQVKSEFMEVEKTLKLKDDALLEFGEIISRKTNQEEELEERLKDEKEQNLRLSEDNQKLVTEVSNIKAAMEKMIQIKVDESLKFEETIAGLSSKQFELVQDLKNEKEQNVCLSEENQRLITEASNTKVEMEKILQLKNDEVSALEKMIAELSVKESNLERRLKDEMEQSLRLSEENQQMNSEIVHFKSSFTQMEDALQLKNRELLGYEETFVRMSNQEIQLEQHLKDERELNEKMKVEAINVKASFSEMEKLLQMKDEELLGSNETIARISSNEEKLAQDLEVQKDLINCMSEEHQKMSAEVFRAKSYFDEMEKVLKTKNDQLSAFEETIAGMTCKQLEIEYDFKNEKGKNLYLSEENKKMVAEILHIKTVGIQMEKDLGIKDYELSRFEETINRMSNKEHDMEKELTKAHDKLNETEKELMKLRLSHDNVNMEIKTREDKNDLFMENVENNFNIINTSVKMIDDKMKANSINQLLENFKTVNERVTQISEKLNNSTKFEALNKEIAKLKKKLDKSEDAYEIVEKEFLSVQRTAIDYNEQIITLQVKYGEITPQDAARLFVDPSKNEKYFKQFVRK
uniref:Kinetochore scaffold 1 n=1 Tax=Rhabditophanes sp. KR3021 TaxID=114890 RepID=A0AC35TZA8_9BILA